MNAPGIQPAGARIWNRSRFKIARCGGNRSHLEWDNSAAGIFVSLPRLKTGDRRHSITIFERHRSFPHGRSGSDFVSALCPFGAPPRGYGHTDGRTGFGAPHVKPSVRPSIYSPLFTEARNPTLSPGESRKKPPLPALPRQSFTVHALVLGGLLAIFA
jgi:hypothetical protein